MDEERLELDEILLKISQPCGRDFEELEIKFENDIGEEPYYVTLSSKSWSMSTEEIMKFSKMLNRIKEEVPELINNIIQEEWYGYKPYKPYNHENTKVTDNDKDKEELRYPIFTDKKLNDRYS